MIAMIDRNGFLSIRAESELEAYAMKQWFGENWNAVENCVKANAIVFDTTPFKHEVHSHAG